jgi:peptidoglycan pentaglycine glycine transferase (the first glycine)
MPFEIVTAAIFPEIEAFVRAHPQGSFLQSTAWPQVKTGWSPQFVVSRGQGKAINGTVLVLIRPVSFPKTAMLYAPRGPVCDPADTKTLAALTQGIRLLAKEHGAFIFKCDPPVAMENKEFIAAMKQLGFRHSFGPVGFEGVQTRFNYVTKIGGRDENAMLAALNQSTRRKIRIAARRGVEIKVGGAKDLDDFSRLMQITGRRDGFAVRPKQYFSRFLAALGDDARLYMGYVQNTPVCGAIAVNYAGRVSYIYGASDNVHRDAMPNYLLQWEMMRWAINSGCHTYDFQGVPGNYALQSGPLFGLYRFKSGFGGEVEELAGEFDLINRPMLNIAAAGASSLAKVLRRAFGAGGRN